MESERRVFVTNDKSVHEKGKLDQTDEAILEEVKSGGGVVIESAEQLQALAKGLSDTFDHCLEFCRKNMTEEKARYIRKIRVDEGYSWRAVARACHEIGGWPINEYWNRVPGAQPMGMALCEVAAEFLGENYRAAPWN